MSSGVETSLTVGMPAPPPAKNSQRFLDFARNDKNCAMTSHLARRPALSESIDMFYVYVLQSVDGKNLYYGFSSNLKQRFAEHQKMPKHAGWKLIYYEAYLNEQDARNRERMLKKYGAAREHLKQRIRRSIDAGLESAG